MRVPNDGDFTTTGQRCASIQYFLVENIDKSCRKTTRVRKRKEREREGTFCMMPRDDFFSSRLCNSFLHRRRTRMRPWRNKNLSL